VLVGGQQVGTEDFTIQQTRFDLECFRRFVPDPEAGAASSAVSRIDGDRVIHAQR